MIYEIERTCEEIDALREKIDAFKTEGRTKFRGMTYEDGLNEMLEWLCSGDDEAGPMD